MPAIGIGYVERSIAAMGRSYKVLPQLARRCNFFGTPFLATAVAISNYFARMGTPIRNLVGDQQ